MSRRRKKQENAGPEHFIMGAGDVRIRMTKDGGKLQAMGPEVVLTGTVAAICAALSKMSGTAGPSDDDAEG
jgi:hypothetical protein